MQMFGAQVDMVLIAAGVCVILPLSLFHEPTRLRHASFVSFAGAICVAALFGYRASVGSVSTDGKSMYDST